MKDVIKSAKIVNGDTLYLKLKCLLHPTDIKRLQSDLQAQSEDVKIIILPNGLDFQDDVNA